MLLEQTGKKWRVVTIRSGWSANGRYYSPAVVRASVEQFRALPVTAHASDFERMDHADRSRNADRDYVGNYIGLLDNPQIVESGGVVEVVCDFDCTCPRLQPLLAAAWAAGHRDFLGFSIDGWGETQPGVAEGRRGSLVTSLDGLHELTLVRYPAAGGRFSALVAGLESRAGLLELTRRIQKENGVWAALLGCSNLGEALRGKATVLLNVGRMLERMLPKLWLLEARAAEGEAIDLAKHRTACEKLVALQQSELDGMAATGDLSWPELLQLKPDNAHNDGLNFKDVVYSGHSLPKVEDLGWTQQPQQVDEALALFSALVDFAQSELSWLKQISSAPMNAEQAGELQRKSKLLSDFVPELLDRTNTLKELAAAIKRPAPELPEEPPVPEDSYVQAAAQESRRLARLESRERSVRAQLEPALVEAQARPARTRFESWEANAVAADRRRRLEEALRPVLKPLQLSRRRLAALQQLARLEEEITARQRQGQPVGSIRWNQARALNREIQELGDQLDRAAVA